MHSHDRTLLARLGFSDPDKKEPLHDLACAYLAEDTQARKLLELTHTKREPDEWELGGYPRFTDRRLGGIAATPSAS